MANKKTNEIFKNDNYKALPSTLYTASHMQYVDKQGNTIEVPISSDFKLLYGFLFDQCRSFKAQDGADGEGQDLYQDWDIIFRVIGRKYTGDKTSLKLVKLLEDAGILVQTKRLNTTSTIKHVFDVSIIPTIKFSNPERDLWVKEQGQRRADRQRQYAEQKKNKLAAIEEAKKQHNQIVQTISSSMMIPSESMQSTNATGVNEQPEQKEPEPEIKTESQSNWQIHQNTLIAQNTKWHSLNDGQKMCVMVEVNKCKLNPHGIKEAFNNEIARLTYQPETKTEDKPKPSYSIVPPAIQAMNQIFNEDDGFDFGDQDIPF